MSKFAASNRGKTDSSLGEMLGYYTVLESLQPLSRLPDV